MESNFYIYQEIHGQARSRWLLAGVQGGKIRGCNSSYSFSIAQLPIDSPKVDSSFSTLRPKFDRKERFGAPPFIRTTFELNNVFWLTYLA